MRISVVLCRLVCKSELYGGKPMVKAILLVEFNCMCR